MKKWEKSTDLLTGETRELLDLLKIKDLVDHVGLSQPPELLKDIGLLTKDLFPVFLNNN
jgi:hypothetical protein